MKLQHIVIIILCSILLSTASCTVADVPSNKVTLHHELRTLKLLESLKTERADNDNDTKDLISLKGSMWSRVKSTAEYAK